MAKVTLKSAETELREHAMAKPAATEHFPWGERAIKVKAKVFLFMFADLKAKTLSLSTKLPESSGVALLLPFAQPTGYGLGKAGWVTARFTASDDVPLAMLLAWIDESYRAVAPKKLIGLPPPSPAAPSGGVLAKPVAAKPKPKPSARRRAK